MSEPENDVRADKILDDSGIAFGTYRSDLRDHIIEALARVRREAIQEVLTVLARRGWTTHDGQYKVAEEITDMIRALAESPPPERGGAYDRARATQSMLEKLTEHERRAFNEACTDARLVGEREGAAPSSAVAAGDPDMNALSRCSHGRPLTGYCRDCRRAERLAAAPTRADDSPPASALLAMLRDRLETAMDDASRKIADAAEWTIGAGEARCLMASAIGHAIEGLAGVAGAIEVGREYRAGAGDTGDAPGQCADSNAPRGLSTSSDASPSIASPPIPPSEPRGSDPTITELQALGDRSPIDVSLRETLQVLEICRGRGDEHAPVSIRKVIELTESVLALRTALRDARAAHPRHRDRGPYVDAARRAAGRVNDPGCIPPRVHRWAEWGRGWFSDMPRVQECDCGLLRLGHATGGEFSSGSYDWTYYCRLDAARADRKEPRT